MSTLLLSSFIDYLSHSSETEDVKKAFALICPDYGIGRVEIIEGESSKILFDAENFDQNTKSSLGDGDIRMIFYKDSSKKRWDEADVKTILEVAFSFYKNSHLNSKLSNAPYVQFMTGLPNSLGFHRIAKRKFSDEELSNYSIIALNIRGFALINKNHSPKYGDLAIKLAAKEIEKLIKDDEILSHHGGDSFVVLIKKERVDHFIDCLNPLYINLKFEESESDRFISLFFTFGIIDINFDNKVFSLSSFVADALTALSYGKVNRIEVVRLDQQLKKEIDLVKDIEMTLDDELDVGNIVIYYQPKVDSITGKIVGAEALARWVKDGNVISPGVFIPVLERTGKIAKLDLFVLDRACHDISHYRSIGNKTVPLSCNISRKDLLVPGFYRSIVNIIEKYNLNYEDIVIEVTETTNLDESQRMLEFVSYLKNHNIKTSLDDFGTGYSSLSALRDFAIDEIKIDKSFIDREELSEKDATILKNVFMLAKQLGIAVVVEGVENKRQLDFVRSLGYCHIQGFYFDKPMPKLEFEARLGIGEYKDREL